MIRSSIVLTLFSCVAAAGCDDLPLEDAPCPCANGWICCADDNICVQSASECTSNATGDPDASPDTPDADDPDVDAGTSTPAHTVFLNFEGATISPGSGSAADNESPLVSGATEIPPFNATVFATTAPRDEVIADLTAAVQDLYAPFDVLVTHVQPSGDDYVMLMAGGSHTDLGLPQGVWGISSLDCEVDDYNVEGDREIAFVFTDDVGAVDYADQVTATSNAMAREIGHTYGLENSTDCRDVMSPTAGCGVQKFLDLDTECPSCTCSSDRTQNTYQILVSVLGD